eukprot:5543717-Pleurochrysis_carterae.AAC.1
MRSIARSALSRGRNNTPATATKTMPSHRTEGPACRFSGMAMARPTLRVTWCQARISVTTRSAPTAARMTSSVYMSAGGWGVVANQMRKLSTQEGEEDDTEALGVVRCAEEAEA